MYKIYQHKHVKEELVVVVQMTGAERAAQPDAIPIVEIVIASFLAKVLLREQTVAPHIHLEIALYLVVITP